MSFPLFDRIRLFLKRGNVYNHESLLQNQNDISKVLRSGDSTIDFSDPHFLIEQTNVQINRLERYKDYDQMDEVGVITLALDMYADEASLRDPERNHSIFVKTSNVRLKDEIEDLLYNTLNIDSQIRPITRYLCKYGDFPCEIVPTSNRDGVSNIKPMFVYNFTRIETKYGDLVGFFYQEDGQEPQYYHPWQVAHMRLTSFEQIYHPYGRSLLDGARRDFRRLRLMEDAALVYRLTRAPEKRVFKVPVGNLSPKEREQYIQIIARRFKKHKFIDPVTGTMNERYAPHIQDDDYWIPVTGDGNGVEIDTLQGAENLDAIADIVYFKKNMVSALKIPFSRVGLADGAEETGKTVAQTSPEFAKAIQWVQDQVIVGIKKIVIVHLAMRGFSIDDIKGFELGMTSASAIDELYRMETWSSRIDIMGGLKELGIFPDEWIVARFTDLTEDELKLIKKTMDIKKANQPPADDGEGGEPPAEDFFESDESNKMMKRMITEDKKHEMMVLLEGLIAKHTSKHSNISSMNHMLNNNEFDGMESKTHGIIESTVEGRDDLINETKSFIASLTEEIE